MATRHSVLPQTPDENLLVDVDLSILGSAPARFAEYEAQVRAEYDWIPAAQFRARRAAILEGFLRRATLYRTEHFQRLYEAQARQNLEKSLREMRRGA
jgi:predicted metal-dependent HD superfamily phosphohydrolase